MNLYLSLLTIICLPISECKNVSEEVIELKECIENSRLLIEQTVSLMREDFSRKLDTVLEDLGYLKKREKMVELCPPGRCAARRKCVLSDDMETFYCTCKDGYGGSHCQLTSPCYIDKYNFEIEYEGEKFPYQCTYRGYYQRVQFNETGGYCVTDYNEVLTGYFIESPEDVHDHSCNCAMHMYWTGQPSSEVTRCKLNGEFDVIACDGDVCSCQSVFGDQTESFSIHESDQWRDACEKLNEIYNL